MSGFLHQLAARTLGLTPQIRPRAALPFAPPPADFTGTELPGDHVAPDTAILERSVAASPSPAKRHEHPHHRTSLPAPLHARQPAQEGSAMPLSLTTTRTAEPADNESPRHRTATPHRITNPVRLAETMRPFVSSSTARPGGGLELEPGQSPSNLLEKPQQTSNDHPAQAQRRFADLETLVSQLLGPSKDGHQEHTDSAPRISLDSASSTGNTLIGITPIRVQASREQPLNPQRKAEAEVAPEVHITIGRLEVNPPARPAPPPLRPRGPAPLSLSDYLARRNGGRS